MINKSFNKRFGQHFLKNNKVINKIINAINPNNNQNLLEIGPGTGALTAELLTRENIKINAIEIDRKLVKLLQLKFMHKSNFKLYTGDILTFDLYNLYKDNENVRIIGNLPYNISTPIIFRLLNSTLMIQDMHFMLQKEVVARIVAKPNSIHRSRLSVMIQYYCKVEHLFNVSNNEFTPAPKVHSSLVRITPFKKPVYQLTNIRIFEYIVRTAFTHRRKTLRNNLKHLISSKDIEASLINPALRAEQLELSCFVTLANKLSAAKFDI